MPESGKDCEDEWTDIEVNESDSAVQEMISENLAVLSECDLALPKVSTPTIEKIAFVIEVEEPTLVAELISLQAENSTEPIAYDEPAVLPVVSNLISDECLHPNIVAESESIVEATISNDVVAEAETIAVAGVSTKPAETKSKTAPSVAAKKRLSAGVTTKPKAKPSTVADAAATKSAPIPRPRTAASQPPVKAIEKKSASSLAPKKPVNGDVKPTSILSAAKRSVSSAATSKSTTLTRASTATTTTTKVTAARLTTKTSTSTTAADAPKRYVASLEYIFC